jgi:hypothetical protein
VYSIVKFELTVLLPIIDLVKYYCKASKGNIFASGECRLSKGKLLA